MTMNKYAKATIGILIVFSIGLVGFYVFSAMYGDGLEKTMNDNGVSEGGPVWNAPLSYGESYSASLVMGILGFFIVLLAMLGLLYVFKRIKKSKDTN